MMCCAERGNLFKAVHLIKARNNECKDRSIMEESIVGRIQKTIFQTDYRAYKNGKRTRQNYLSSRAIDL